MAEKIEKQLGLLDDLNKPEEAPVEKPSVEVKGRSVFDEVDEPQCNNCSDQPGGCSQCGFGNSYKKFQK